MENKKKIFCALDFSDLSKTIEFAELIKNHVGGVKLGLEFFMNNGLDGVLAIKKIGIPIFLDLKFNDIPNTVKKAVKNVIKLEPDYLTAHLNGGKKMLEEIVEIKGITKIIGVSVLTSLNDEDMKNFGLGIDTKKFTENLIEMGKDSGIDGVVSSPHEVKSLKRKMPDNFLFCTPGIRLPEDDLNDQKRVASPGDAIRLGSSILIIGRAITHSKNPIEIIKKITDDIG